MSHVSGEDLKTLGPISAGPTGFDVHYQFNSGAELQGGTGTALADLNLQSLERAIAHNEGGANKEVAKTLEPVAKASKALTNISANQAKTDAAYANQFAKAGKQSLAENGPPMPSGFRRSDHRAALSQGGPAKNVELSKNPLLRNQQRRMMTLRKAFEEMKLAQQKPVAVDSKSLSQDAQDRLEHAAIERGDQYTPTGKTIPQASMHNARTPVGMPKNNLVSAFAKWENAGLLAGGSYINLAARLIRS